MRNPVSVEQLEPVLAAVRKFPAGASLHDIMGALASPPDDRTVRRWLDVLVDSGRVSQVGSARGTRYCAVPEESSAAVSASPAIPSANHVDLPKIPSPAPSVSAAPAAAPVPEAVVSRATQPRATANAVAPATPPTSSRPAAGHKGWEWQFVPGDAHLGEDPYGYIMRQMQARGPSRGYDYVQSAIRMYLPSAQQLAFFAMIKPVLARHYATYSDNPFAD